MQKVTIVDYGMGNLYSIQKVLERLKVQVVISSDPKDILEAEKLILPGVGHYGKAMENLQKLELIGVLNEAVLEKKIPVLGICLGMQLMARNSEEGNVSGLNWIDAEVVKFQMKDKLKYKVPHIGWNTVAVLQESELMKGIDPNDEFYFVHSYFMRLNDPKVELNSTKYEQIFTSAIQKGTIYGVQYHPEKSHGFGEKILQNFVAMRSRYNSDN